MPAIGYVTRDEAGNYKGQLKTLSIRVEIRIVSLDDRPATTSRTSASTPAMSRSAPAGSAVPSPAAGTMCPSRLPRRSSGRAGSTPISAARAARPRTGSPSSGTRSIDRARRAAPERCAGAAFGIKRELALPATTPQQSLPIGILIAQLRGGFDKKTEDHRAIVLG